MSKLVPIHVVLPENGDSLPFTVLYEGNLSLGYNEEGELEMWNNEEHFAYSCDELVKIARLLGIPQEVEVQVNPSIKGLGA